MIELVEERRLAKVQASNSTSWDITPQPVLSQHSKMYHQWHTKSSLS